MNQVVLNIRVLHGAMASQDGQPDRILRGCTQPTLAQDLPEPAAGPPAGGALEAAAGPPARRWCFGGGGCAARDRRAHALRLLRAPGGSAAGRCVSELSHGRQTAPAPRPLVAGGFVLGGEAGLLYQQVTEQRQQNPDSRLKWETVEAAYKETLQRFQRRTMRSSRGGPFLPIQVWLRRGFTAEQVRKGNYEEHPQLGPTSSRYTTKVPHLQRYVRRPAVLPPGVFLAPSLLPAVRPPSALPTPPATPVAGVVPGVVLPDAPAALPLPTCFLRCVPPAALPLPSRLVLGLLRPAALPLPSRLALGLLRPAALPLPAALVRPAVLPLLPSHARRLELL